MIMIGLESQNVHGEDVHGYCIADKDLALGLPDCG